MKYILSVFLLFLGKIGFVVAQHNQAFIPTLQTLQIIANNNWEAPAIIVMNHDETLSFSFDELTHEFHNYRYKIEHCNADWSLSDLPEMEYIDGFNDNLIEDYEHSFNTTLLYTHYQFVIPNDDIMLKCSGNYRLSVYDEDEPQKTIAHFFFSLVDKRTSIRTTVKSNTLIDTNAQHQQVDFQVGYKDLNINTPQTTLKVCVLQNRRWDNAVTQIKPTSVTAYQANYENSKELIFPAGNEYRRFELVSPTILMQGVENIQRFEPYYHANLYTDEPRKNYIFDKDQNGLYRIRYDEAENNNIEADYMFVHFTLKTPYLVKGKLYLEGAFSNDLFTRQYEMKYNFKTQRYEGVQLLKMGAYNYQYLFVPNGSKKGNYAPIEGNFHQTENEYLVLVYYRPFGSRYDQLIGMQRVSYGK
jgi:hypothetical protein